MLGMEQALTHKQSLETFKLKEIGGTEYINVYLDTDGKRHYSTEDFAIGQEGIWSADDAFEEIAKLTLKNNWQYCRTLTVNHGNTSLMDIKLEMLEMARKILAEAGVDYNGMGVDETQERAADTVDMAHD